MSVVRRHRFISSFESLESRRHLHDGPHDGAEPSDTTAGASYAVVAVDAGGEGLTDHNGQTWGADKGFSGDVQSVANGSKKISNSSDDPLFASVREGSAFVFSAKVPNGQYTLELCFAELDFTSANKRLMNVTVEDKMILQNWDIVAAAGGGSKAVSKRFNVKIADGRLSVGFNGVMGEATISAIMLTPGATFFPSATTWKSKAPLALQREEANSFVFDDKLYVVGGYFNNVFEATQRVDRYDPATNTWTQLADAPTKITHAGVAVDKKTGTVWFVGGYIGDFPAPPGTATVWKYDVASDTWTNGPSIPSARGAGGAAIVGRKLYFFGGANKHRNADQDDVWALDLRTPKKWLPRASLPNPRNHFMTAVVRDQIYVIGGQHKLELESENQGDVHVYDVTTDTWSAVPNMPRPYSHATFSTAVYKNRYIVLAGGESPHDVGRRDVFAFDVHMFRWASLTNLPADRRAPAGGIIGNTFYLAGGYDRDIGQSANVYAADLSGVFASVTF